MISNRLTSLVKYIDKEDKIIDIGCDHALLDIYLIKNKIVNKIIVSDIHEKALNGGILNIKRYKLSKSIEARLGNGLEVLNDSDDINTILISGMGTSTILKILDNKNLYKIDKLILQSNNDHETLRREIVKLGYIISDEEYFVDNKKSYINIVFKKGEAKYSKNELKYGPFLMKNEEYLNFELNKIDKIYQIIPKMKLKYRIILYHDIKYLKKLLKACKNK